MTDITRLLAKFATAWHHAGGVRGVSGRISLRRFKSEVQQGSIDGMAE
jgi:hypothetical protein